MTVPPAGWLTTIKCQQSLVARRLPSRTDTRRTSFADSWCSRSDDSQRRKECGNCGKVHGCLVVECCAAGACSSGRRWRNWVIEGEEQRDCVGHGLYTRLIRKSRCERPAVLPFARESCASEGPHASTCSRQGRGVHSSIDAFALR